jgi:hypothetical protein
MTTALPSIEAVGLEARRRGRDGGEPVGAVDRHCGSKAAPSRHHDERSADICSAWFRAPGPSWWAACRAQPAGRAL